MKKVFTVKIDRVNDLVTFIGKSESYTSGIDSEFKIGEVLFKIIRLGNTYKINLNNQNFRLYNNLNIVLPTTRDDSMSYVRKPNNSIEVILERFRIPLSILSFSSSVVRIPTKYSLHYTDGEYENESKGFITYRSFNWIIIGQPTLKGYNIKKIICYDNIVNDTAAIKSLTDKLAFIKKGYLNDNYIEYDKDKDIFDFAYLLKLILIREFDLPENKVHDIVWTQSDYDRVCLDNINDESILTDGIIMNNKLHSNLFDVRDFSYIIRFAPLKDNNISYIKNKLVCVILNPDRANRGTVYTVQHILSNFNVIKLYDMEKDSELYDYKN